MKVLHLPANVAGNAFGLVQGERSLGLDSRSLLIGDQKYLFPSDLSIPSGKNMISKLYNRLKIFFQVRSDYDIYHFNFGSSLLHYMKLGLNLTDLPYYAADALKVVTYQGCDARQKYPTMARVNKTGGYAACFSDGCYDGVCNSGKRDTQRRRAIDKMMKHSQHAFALNPDLLYFLPEEKSSFLPYTVPNFDLIQPKSEPFFVNDTINIVHAPTQRVTKGSQYVINAINSLQSKYPNKIEFTLIENVPYSQALELYRKADLLIDQMLIGWYGGIAVEVMKMGIPVAAYINDNDIGVIPKGFADELPIIKITVDTIEDILSNIIEHREQLIEIGKASVEFVNKWHHPTQVAKTTREVYQGLSK